MEETYFKEIFDYPIQEFKEHLESPENERIIFSGKYGIGKTKFLEHIFQKGNQEKVFGSDKYNVYKVFPVNYSISSNEDILKYIKYDIILEVLRKSVSMDELDLSYLATLPKFMAKNLHKVAASMVLMVPKIGKDIVDAFEKIDKLKEEFFKFHDNANKSDGDRMIEYIDELDAKEGSLYENNVITRIISDTIKKDKSKESVLIVDDVDRLDPEHLFRILNVFAAHFDGSPERRNKFNFDKIIIVCDFHNIRNAFHHRYGNEVDFMGYIDKFYSSDVYYFDNKKAIIEILGNIFKSFQFTLIGSDNSNYTYDFYFRDNLIFSIVTLLIRKNFISLRNVIKMRGKVVKYHYESITFNNRNSELVAWQIPKTMQLKILKDFFGDFNSFKRIADQCLINNDYIDNFESHFEFFISILSFSQHNFFSDQIFRFQFRSHDLVVESKSRNGRDIRVNLFQFNGQHADKSFDMTKPCQITIQQFWEGFIDTIQILHEIGYLK